MRKRAELVRRLRALPSLQRSGCSEDAGFAASREAGCTAAAIAITLLIALTSSSSPTFILAIAASAASMPTSLHHQRLTSTTSNRHQNRHHQIQDLSFSCRERPFLSAAREA